MSVDRHWPRTGRKPTRWNRYIYVLGDSINLWDKAGLDLEGSESTTGTTAVNVHGWPIGSRAKCRVHSERVQPGVALLGFTLSPGMERSR
jgi:hypothetical protein